MHQLTPLIKDLGFILICAAFTSILFKRINQPVVLGYLVAGFLLGPHFPFFPTVIDIQSITTWAEIGVIFLLFSLGLEFSFRKVTRVGGGAGLTAIVEIIFMIGIGYLTGRLFGWTKIDSLFLGSILSVSSTTIILRAFDEFKLKGSKIADYIFGILIIEDLAAILILVALSSIALSQSFSGFELGFTVIQLIFFLTLFFVLGIFLIPILMRAIKNDLSNETHLIFSIGMCLLSVLLASQFGYSAALGAFLMGSIFSETTDSHRIERLLVPVRDLFSAIFFVSIGMLIDPSMILKHWPVILVVSIVTILGKFLSLFLSGLISGRGLTASTLSGLSMAQIGEFSFIIANLGATLKVTSPMLYPIAVAVSAITCFTTPFLIQTAKPIEKWLEQKIPDVILKRLHDYESLIRSPKKDSMVSLLLQEYGIKILVNFCLSIAVTLLSARVLLPFLVRLDLEIPALRSLIGVSTILVAGPFLWGIVLAAPRHKVSYSGQQALHLKRGLIVVSAIRWGLGFLTAAFIIGQFISISLVTGVVAALLILSIVWFGKSSEKFYLKMETKFFQHLSIKEKQDLERMEASELQIKN